MLKEAIDRILALALPPIVAVDSRDYATGKLEPIYEPRADALIVGSLRGIKTFLDEGEGKGWAGPDTGLTLLVKPDEVRLLSKPRGPWDRRQSHVVAKLPANCSYPFGSWLDVETFVINMHAGFVANDQSAAIIALASNMSRDQSITHADDGVSQRVLTSAGVHLKGQATVPNPVTLAAWRTFPEVGQPFAQYVFRVRAAPGNAPQLALFDVAGSGRWQLEASAAIAAWLRENIPGVPVMA